MSEQRSKFLKEFAIKKNLKDSDIQEALKGKSMIPSVVSIPKGKRDNESDTQDLEEQTKESKKKKQRRS
jgi:ribosomal protein L12E/L44/L45/RPP1/RPP2